MSGVNKVREGEKVSEEVALYKSGLSITQVSEKTGIPRSTLRFRFKRKGVLRSTSEAIRLRFSSEEYSHPLKGKSRKFTEEWKRNMSRSALKRWEGKAKGWSLKPSGYIEATTGPNKGKRQHVVVMEQYLGRKLNSDEVVHHINHIKTDNRIENLRVMTVSDHCRYHALVNVRAGKNYDISKEAKKGEQHRKAKLSEADVIGILINNKPTKYYCEKFGVKRTTINKIKSRHSWKHIKI